MLKLLSVMKFSKRKCVQPEKHLGSQRYAAKPHRNNPTVKAVPKA